MTIDSKFPHTSPLPARAHQTHLTEHTFKILRLRDLARKSAHDPLTSINSQLSSSSRSLSIRDMPSNGRRSVWLANSCAEANSGLICCLEDDAPLTISDRFVGQPEWWNNGSTWTFLLRNHESGGSSSSETHLPVLTRCPRRVDFSLSPKTLAVHRTRGPLSHLRC